MKNKIILHNYFWDKTIYNINDLNFPELMKVFKRIAKHLEYWEETIDEYLQSNK